MNLSGLIVFIKILLCYVILSVIAFTHLFQDMLTQS